LDIDSQTSSFDSVVAIDAGVDQLLRYENVQVTTVTPIVHGAMFTRGGDDLKHTAIFVGGSNVASAEAVLKSCQDAFFGPVRVSLMLDAGGCNTTAAAAVVAAARHINLAGARAVVLGGTGPVGRRVGQLLAGDGADVILTSRSLDRANDAANEISSSLPNLSGHLRGGQAGSPGETADVVRDAAIVIACGAAGVELIDQVTLAGVATLKVAIDLNAVPPAGIEGIGAGDKAKSFGAGVAYGAIGVGGLKMKTHRAAIESLFTSNDKVLNAAEIYAIAKSIG
jgi:hypothetical protein